jgi:hypothetical protein
MAKKLLYCLMIFTFIGSVTSAGLIKRPCQTNQLVFVNGLHEDVKVSLRIKSSALTENRKVLETVIKKDGPVNESIFSDVAEFVYDIRVESLGTDIIYEEIYGGYVVPHDGYKHMFFIDAVGIHHHQWNMFKIYEKMEIISTILWLGHYISNRASCVDDWLLSLLR